MHASAASSTILTPQLIAQMTYVCNNDTDAYHHIVLHQALLIY